MQHAACTLTKLDQSRSLETLHREPTRAIDELDFGSATFAAYRQPLGFGGERIGIQVKHRKQAQPAVIALARFHEQRALAMPVQQIFGKGFVWRNSMTF